MKKKLATLAALICGTTVSIHCINKLIFTLSNIKGILDDTHGLFYEWRFGKIFYTKQGSGKPILLIHDLNVFSSSYEWHEVVKSLSKTNTVYAIDLIGCGRSDKPNVTYTNFFYVQLVNDFIKDVIQQKADVIATGISTSFTLMACHQEPNLFHNLIFICPDNISRLRQVPKKRNKMMRLLINTPIIGTFIYNIVVSKKNAIEYLTTDIWEKYLDAYYESAHKGGAKAKYLYSSLVGNYLNVDISPALKQINHNISIITSDKTSETITNINSYTSLNPSIECFFMHGTNGLPQLSKPLTLSEQIKIYLS